MQATLTVTEGAGTRLPGVRVTGHFFDDYWLDQTVAGKTDAVGNVTFRHVGPPALERSPSSSPTRPQPAAPWTVRGEFSRRM